MTMQNACFSTDEAASGGADRTDLTVYYRHIEEGISIRALAREYGTHPSTIMRQVRRVEAKRDDPLCDQAIDGLVRDGEGPARMEGETPESKARFEKAARQVLMALNRPGSCLAVVPTLEMAAVVHEDDEGAEPLSIKRTTAERMAVLDWISATVKARVIRYQITAAGRAALRRMVAADESRHANPELMNPYGDQHRDMATGTRTEDGRRRYVRYNGAESPVSLLAKHKDPNGKRFLAPELVSAAERIREDFELAQMGPRVTQDWDRFLTAGARGQFQGDRPAGGSQDARDRVGDALRALGPGLGDVVLRVCCFLEGLESAEKRFGWSARSGKIVLRIALQRLAAHYEALGARPLIG